MDVRRVLCAAWLGGGQRQAFDVHVGPAEQAQVVSREHGQSSWAGVGGGVEPEDHGLDQVS